ncbi:hypothetical protein LWI28_003675 [Acer negundo]|uniref:Protein kinase domain-containing protein n=1 Tax=Acer negundo TaxID=4023 RepID=A0AAD5J336_ACENE|nr:hypothetical protein LWI28_003675 [Acer negundo]
MLGNFWRSLEGPFLVLGLEVCKPVVKSWTLPTAGGFKLNVDADQYVDFVLLAFVDCVCVLMVDCIGAIVVALKRGSSVGSSDSSRHRYITEEINKIGKGNITANIFSYRELCVATSNFNPENMLCEALDRNTRMKISRAAVKGLEYLHESASPPVIYRDSKASNILLDKDFNAKLSDLGLAKLGPTGDKTHVYSFRVLFLKKSHQQFKTNKRAESSYLEDQQVADRKFKTNFAINFAYKIEMQLKRPSRRPMPLESSQAFRSHNRNRKSTDLGEGSSKDQGMQGASHIRNNRTSNNPYAKPFPDKCFSSGESRDGAAESVEIQNRRFGATIMMIGVVLLVGYMMFSNKRVSSTSSYSKQMKVNFWETCWGIFGGVWRVPFWC